MSKLHLSLRVLSVLACGLFAASCGDSPTGPRSRITSTSLVLSSDAGDYIGGGNSRRYTLADGAWQVQATSSPSGSGVSHISVWFEGADWWHLDLAAPQGKMLTPAVYKSAERWPFQAATKPGLSFTANGRGCNTVTGEFIILELVLSSDHSVERLHAIFKQHCEGGSPALRGEIGVIANPWR